MKIDDSLHALRSLPAGLFDRRSWLKVGTLGISGLSLPWLLRAEAASRPKIRSCVLFVLQGGPSQLDIWDLKPNAAVGVRGDFRPIQTRVPGFSICEHLPRLARVANLFSIVRSMTHRMVFHNAATYQALTGRAPSRDGTDLPVAENDHPHPGAMVALKRPGPSHLPTAVSLPNLIEEGLHTVPGQQAGFLGARYAPFAIEADPNADGFTVDGLAPTGVDLASRHALRRAFDGVRWLREDRRVQEMDACQQRALDLLARPAAQQAFELQREPAALRERYGRHKAGQSLLLARRLVEAGVRLVTVYWGGRLNKPLPFWDTHAGLFSRLKDELLPPFDQCFSAFLEDLHTRGLLDSTLVVCMGEFGRTPRVGQFTGNGADPTGRDHWPHCYSLLVAGGPAGGGRILGRSDQYAAYPADDPYTPAELTASILHALGVNPGEQVRDTFGRLVPLCAGRIRPRLFG
jgi:hypothetical protein